MQVTQEVPNGLEHKLKVVIPTEEIDKEVDKRLNEMKKTVKIPGFRPGNVKLSVVKQRFGKAVRAEVIQDYIRKSYLEAIAQEKLNPASDPVVEIVSGGVIAGEALEYTATFEVYPTVHLNNVEGIEVEQLDAQIMDADVDGMLEKLRKQQAEWAEVDRPAQSGDKIVIDYEGFMDGQAFEGGSGKNIQVELGTGVMIPGFEEGLLGAKAGDARELNVKFPENYHNTKFAGLPALFKVTVHKVLEAKLPELNDEFAEKMGIKEGGIEHLKTLMRDNMERELAKATKNLLKQQLLDKFLELNPLEIPKALVEAEIGRLQQEAEQQFAANKMQKSISDFPRENFREFAEIRVTLGLLFAEYIKINDIKVDPARVRAFIEQFAASYPQPEQVIAWYYNNKQQLAQVEAVVLEEQVIDKLLEQVKVTKKVTSYQDVVNYQPTDAMEVA